MLRQVDILLRDNELLTALVRDLQLELEETRAGLLVAHQAACRNRQADGRGLDETLRDNMMLRHEAESLRREVGS
jgi:hypothetical protein